MTERLNSPLGKPTHPLGDNRLKQAIRLIGARAHPKNYQSPKRSSVPLRRGVSVLLLAAVLMASTSGCSTSAERGQSAASAEKAILSIKGVETAKFHLSGAYSGFQKYWGEDVVITLKPGFQPKDTTAFVKYIFATAWSVNEHEPDGIGIVLTTTPQVNLDAVGKLAGWTDLKTFADLPSGVVTGTRSLAKKLGPWPSSPPKKSSKTDLVESSNPTP